MAPAPKPRTRRSSRSGSQSGSASGPGGASSETTGGLATAPGPRPATAVTAKKPAAKRHNRRVAGEALVPLPARKKYPKARAAMARPAKRMPPFDGLQDGAAFAPFIERDSWHQTTTAREPSFIAKLLQEFKGRLRAQVRRMQPRRVLLDQATARYHQLLADAELTRPSA